MFQLPPFKQSLGQIEMIGSNVTNFGVKQYVVTKPARMRAYSEYLVCGDEHSLAR